MQQSGMFLGIKSKKLLPIYNKKGINKINTDIKRHSYNLALILEGFFASFPARAI